jgi:hypothetical protein
MTPPVGRMLDFLDLFCGKYDGQQLSGRYIVRALPRVFCVKNYNGYPLDTLYVDTDPETGKPMVFDNYTEGDPNANAALSGWGNPNAFKQHTGNINRGNKMMFRNIPWPLTAPLEVFDATTPFQIFTPRSADPHADWNLGSVLSSQIHQVGSQRRVLNPPVVIDWKGDVGKCLTFNYQYFYNGTVDGKTFTALEEYPLAFDPDVPSKQFGLVNWKLYHRGSKYATRYGTFDLSDTSGVSNKLGGFKGRTPDNKNDQNARLVVFPFLGINGRVA